MKVCSTFTHIKRRNINSSYASPFWCKMILFYTYISCITYEINTIFHFRYLGQNNPFLIRNIGLLLKFPFLGLFTSTFTTFFSFWFDCMLFFPFVSIAICTRSSIYIWMFSFRVLCILCLANILYSNINFYLLLSEFRMCAKHVRIL